MAAAIVPIQDFGDIDSDVRIEGAPVLSEAAKTPVRTLWNFDGVRTRYINKE
jgi:hypothetical protein